MPSYTVWEIGTTVTITDKDFIAKGGEKSVYGKGSTAYCIYHNPANAIPSAKIQELSVLSLPEIIKPTSKLLDSKKRHVGETMPLVTDSYAPTDKSIRPLVLCHLFTNSFRRKHGVTNDHIVKVTDSILRIVDHCHSKGVILVDPNETNWLVRPTLDGVYLIDTSCCQTANFPGTAIKLAIRDWTRSQFDRESDRFSIAVVLAWLWSGIHPYTAFHPDWENADPATVLESRIRKHASFFDPKTQFNRACRPLSEIPSTLRGWLKSVLHDGNRLPPPDHCGAAIAVVRATPASVSVSVAGLNIAEISRHKHDILAVYGPTIVTSDDPRVIVRTPIYDRPIACRVHDALLTLTTDDTQQPIPIQCEAQSIFESDNRLYAVGRTSVAELVFNELSNKSIRATVRHVGSIADLPTTRTYPGCIVQNLLGRYLLSTFPDPGRCQQYQLRELEGWQILSAKYERGVFAAMVESGGQYALWTYRLSRGTQEAERIGTEFGEVNFCVTSRGVCVLLEPSGHLRAFLAPPGTTRTAKRVQFPQPDATLFWNGTSVLSADGRILSKVTLT